MKKNIIEICFILVSMLSFSLGQNNETCVGDLESVLKDSYDLLDAMKNLVFYCPTNHTACTIYAKEIVK